MSVNFTFQIHESFDEWYWCTFLAQCMDWIFWVLILSGKFDFVSGKSQEIVREFYSTLNKNRKYSRTSVAWTCLGPWKLVPVKGSSSQPGWLSILVNWILGTLVFCIRLLRSEFWCCYFQFLLLVTGGLNNGMTLVSTQAWKIAYQPIKSDWLVKMFLWDFKKKNIFRWEWSLEMYIYSQLSISQSWSPSQTTNISL